MMSLEIEKKAPNVVGDKKQQTRLSVFLPAFLVVGGGAILGIVNNQLLTDISMNGFIGSLRGLGWLYQIISIAALIIVFLVTFSKLGNIRLGGSEAKPKYPFLAWFAMALTGGIATGVITYGVNEPIIYLVTFMEKWPIQVLNLVLQWLLSTLWDALFIIGHSFLMRCIH
ncbi:BCCT family transporter [Robertmurraya beringensis]|uniref:BCCT family transporter n=1 Tax=Robertmurraya beringensis TaxID=641660 RepID=A0ABV6KQ17_9BACI